jgi:ethanolamine utilization microcompartment shell protein EutS
MKKLIIFFTLCIATLGISQPSNPILLLDATNATSSSWTDGSANSNNVTFYNSPIVSSSNGGTVTFNGTNQYGQAPSGFADFTNGITILFFGDLNGVSNWERIIDFGNGPYNNNILVARYGTTGNLSFQFYNGTSTATSMNITIGITSGMGFYSARADGTTCTLSNQNQTTSITSSVLPSNITRTNNYIGESNWVADDFFDGSIGVLAVYDRALTDAEIANFYNTYSSRYSLSALPYAPSITASTSILNFSECGGSTSAAQSFAVSGANLSADVTVTAPSGYELATTETGSYSAALTLSENSGSVASTTIWVRATSSLSAEGSADLTLVSGGTSESIALVNGLANGLHLDGTDDYMEVTNTGQFDLSTMTLEGWFKPTSANDNEVLFSQRNATNSTGARYSIHMNAATDEIGIYNGTSFTTLSYTIENNNWYHIAAVLTSSATKIYVNGTLAGTINTGMNTSVTGVPFRIGAPELIQYQTEYFPGYVDEVRVWNDERTATEIANNYQQSVSPSEAGLIAYYNFDQGLEAGTNTGNTTVRDLVGSNDGTLTNLALSGSTSNFVVGYFPEITGGRELSAGETAQLSHAQTGGTWASSNTAVASVDQTGLVTAITSGSTNITYTLCEAQATYSLVVPEQNSFSFDGSNDYAAVTDATLGTVTGDFTIEAWIYIDVNQNSEIFMRNGDGTGSSQVHYGLRYRAGDLMLHLGTGLSSSNYYYVRTTNAIPTGEWIHVAGVFNAGTGATLYVNGEAQTTDAPSTNTNASINYGSSGTGINTIGKYRTLTSDHNPYDGRIDELRIWNIARTASEIQSNMGNQIDPSSSDLVAYYRFNNGTRNVTNSGVTTLSDLTGNGNDATIGSSSLTGTASNWSTGFIPPITGNTTTTIASTTLLANAATGGTWSSSNTSVATVDQTGLVTGVSTGSTTISYVKDGNTATAYLNVFDPSNAGPITIVASGGGTEGTNWIKAGNELFSNSTSAVSVNASDVVSYAAAGDLIVRGASVAINTDINTGASHNLTFKSKEDIDINTNSDITTNGGSVIFWSNSDGATSYGSTIFYPNSSVTTNGGHLWIGGGSGSATWNNLTVGDGYAVGGTTIYPVSNGSVEAGVYLESSSLSTSGGSIHISGSGKITDTYGMIGIGVVDIDAGSGTVDVDILTDGSGYRGVSVGHHHSAIPGNFALRSTNSASDAISFQIDATGAASHAFVTGGTVLLENTGTGGVELVTTAPSGQYGIRPGYSTTISTDIQLLAASGPIVLNTNTSPIDKENNNCFITIGSKSGSNVTTSSSDITITTSDLDDQFVATLNTSGSVNVQPKSGNSFSAGASTGNLTVANTISEYIVGSATNTSDITIGSLTTIAGPITVYGDDINVNQDLNTTTSSSGILLKGSGNITIAASKSIVTNGGDITLWSNSDDEATNGGYIYLQDNSTLDSRIVSDRTAANGSSDDENGGAIILGGGAGTTAPLGYALNTTNTLRGGVNLGTESGGQRHNCNISLISGGGNISIKGQQSSTYNGDAAGINAYEGFVFDAGKTGNIDLVGNATAANSSYSDGLNLGNYATTANGTPSYIKTVNGDISINGSASNATVHSRGVTLAGGSVGMNIQSTGAGSIEISGTPGGTGTQYNILLIGTNVLAKSGTIDLIGGSTGKVFSSSYASNIGFLAGSDVTSSTSNINVTGDDFDLSSGFNFNTAGVLTIEPFSTSFTDAFNTNQLTYSADLSGLTIGKSGNSADVTIGSSTTIAGPIAVYGGAVAVNADVTTTQGGDFSLDGNNISVSSNLFLAGNLKAFGQTNLTIAANKSITSTGGDIILWSDYDADNNGYISAGDNISLTTSGGDIVLAGGSDTDSDGIPDGFAKSSTTHGVTLGTTINNTTTIASSGGDIIIRGECSSTTTQTGHGVQQTGLFDIDAGAGSVTIEGVSANWYGIDFAELISASSTPWTIKSSATTGAAITIKGTTTGASQYGVVFNWPVQKQLISDGGGSISITGTGTSGQWGIFSQNVDYLSSSGAITLDGGEYGIKVTDSGSRFGALSGSDVTSSSAPVTLKGDIISIADWANGSSTTVLTSGTTSIQPSTTSSFGSGIIWPAGTATSGWSLGKTSGNSTTIFDWESITVN